jgi:hypothetical protein
VPAPDPAAYYRPPTFDEPIKTGDNFLGGAPVAPGDPLLSLSPEQSLRSQGSVATAYAGPIYAHSAPSRDVRDLGPIVDEPVVGIGYVVLLSYTRDYAEPARDHPLRLITPLWDLFALPDTNGLRESSGTIRSDVPRSSIPCPLVTATLVRRTSICASSAWSSARCYRRVAALHPSNNR